MEHEFYVGWGTLALLNAGLAQIKNNASGGRNLGGLGWFVISLFIGPIATLLIVVVKRGTSSEGGENNNNDDECGNS